MKACRSASVVFGLAMCASYAACREGAPLDVPPVTVAVPPTITEALSPTPMPMDANVVEGVPLKASFVDVPAKLDDGLCTRELIAVAEGKVTAMKETLGPGDVLVVSHPLPLEIAGTGLVVVASIPITACAMLERPAPEKNVIRATAAPELKWAGGAMHGHLDVVPGKTNVSPDLYLGRLDGTAPVAEHEHAGSWEVIAALEAHGTFVVGGIESRLGPHQIVFVPPGVKHSWKPDPGSKLAAVQMYSPPGPEQRFIALAADAGASPTVPKP